MSSCCCVPGLGELRLCLCVLSWLEPSRLDPDCPPELLMGHLQDLLPREGLVGDKG